MKELRIGDVARRAGIGVETVRYYEREGLLEAPRRAAGSGYRLYGPEAIARIAFVRKARSLGFSLAEIRDLLALRSDEAATCADVRQRVAAKLDVVDEKIALLQGMRRVLVELLAACPGSGPTSDCPILDALGADETSSGG